MVGGQLPPRRKCVVGFDPGGILPADLRPHELPDRDPGGPEIHEVADQHPGNGQESLEKIVEARRADEPVQEPPAEERQNHIKNADHPVPLPQDQWQLQGGEKEAHHIEDAQKKRHRVAGHHREAVEKPFPVAPEPVVDKGMDGPPDPPPLQADPQGPPRLLPGGGAEGGGEILFRRDEFPDPLGLLAPENRGAHFPFHLDVLLEEDLPPLHAPEGETHDVVKHPLVDPVEAVRLRGRTGRGCHHHLRVRDVAAGALGFAEGVRIVRIRADEEYPVVVLHRLAEVQDHVGDDIRLPPGGHHDRHRLLRNGLQLLPGDGLDLVALEKKPEESPEVIDAIDNQVVDTADEKDHDQYDHDHPADQPDDE